MYYACRWHPQGDLKCVIIFWYRQLPSLEPKNFLEGFYFVFIQYNLLLHGTLHPLTTSSYTCNPSTPGTHFLCALGKARNFLTYSYGIFRKCFSIFFATGWELYHQTLLPCINKTQWNLLKFPVTFVE